MEHRDMAKVFITALAEAVEKHRGALKASQCLRESSRAQRPTNVSAMERRFLVRIVVRDGAPVAAEATPGRELARDRLR